ncbi:MAG TPA: hypothetical protein VHD56_01085 [Tepidisphaeraceae bacterium]|nr:hypothetical protein [Tepidisphaeraceae bacterium]
MDTQRTFLRIGLRRIHFLKVAFCIGLAVLIFRSVTRQWRNNPNGEFPLDEAGLNRVINHVRFNNTRFKDAIDELRKKSGTDIIVDWHALKVMDDIENTPVTFEVSGAVLADVLRNTLFRVDFARLSYAVRNSTIVVGLRERNEPQILRIYDVYDIQAAARAGAVQIKMPYALYYPPSDNGARDKEQWQEGGIVFNRPLRWDDLFIDALEPGSRGDAPEEPFGSLHQFGHWLVVVNTPEGHRTTTLILSQLRAQIAKK